MSHPLHPSQIALQAEIEALRAENGDLSSHLRSSAELFGNVQQYFQMLAVDSDLWDGSSAELSSNLATMGKKLETDMHSYLQHVNASRKSRIHASEDHLTADIVSEQVEGLKRSHEDALKREGEYREIIEMLQDENTLLRSNDEFSRSSAQERSRLMEQTEQKARLQEERNKQLVSLIHSLEQEIRRLKEERQEWSATVAPEPPRHDAQVGELEEKMEEQAISFEAEKKEYEKVIASLKLVNEGLQRRLDDVADAFEREEQELIAAVERQAQQGDQSRTGKGKLSIPTVKGKGPEKEKGNTKATATAKATAKGMKENNGARARSILRSRELSVERH
jgi:hypothetical protein